MDEWWLWFMNELWYCIIHVLSLLYPCKDEWWLWFMNEWWLWFLNEWCVNHYHTICDEHIINCDPWQNNSVNCTNCLTITIVSSETWFMNES